MVQASTSPIKSIMAPIMTLPKSFMPADICVMEEKQKEANKMKNTRIFLSLLVFVLRSSKKGRLLTGTVFRFLLLAEWYRTDGESGEGGRRQEYQKGKERGMQVYRNFGQELICILHLIKGRNQPESSQKAEGCAQKDAAAKDPEMFGDL